MAKINYDAINFKNKDVDKFSTRFGQGDPGKGIVSQAKDAMNTIAKTPRSKGYIDYYTQPDSYGDSTPLSIDTTGLASGKNNFTIRDGAGRAIGNVSNSEAKTLVKKIETGNLPTRKTRK